MFPWDLVILLAMDQHILSKNMQLCVLLGICRSEARMVEMQNGCGWEVFNPRDTPWQLLSIAQPGYYCPAINAGTINY